MIRTERCDSKSRRSQIDRAILRLIDQRSGHLQDSLDALRPIPERSPTSASGSSQNSFRCISRCNHVERLVCSFAFVIRCDRRIRYIAPGSRPALCGTKTGASISRDRRTKFPMTRKPDPVGPAVIHSTSPLSLRRANSSI